MASYTNVRLTDGRRAQFSASYSDLNTERIIRLRGFTSDGDAYHADGADLVPPRDPFYEGIPLTMKRRQAQLSKVMTAMMKEAVGGFSF